MTPTIRILCVLSCVAALTACGETSSTDDVTAAPNGDCTDLRPGDVCELEDPHMGLFWETIHANRYEDIPAAIEQLQAVLAENPAAVNSIGWHDDSIHRDIDTPMDLS